MKWGTLLGSWGDVIVQLGIFRERVGVGGVIFYGGDPALVEFLEAQDCVTEVRWTVPKPNEFQNTLNLAWNEATYLEALTIMLEGTGVDPEDVEHTQLKAIHSATWDNIIPIYKGLKLPEECTAWAKSMVKHLPRPIFLIQPYSIRTNGWLAHWPYWGNLLQWLFADRDATYIVCGSGWGTELFEPVSNVINLVNQTPSQAFVFALASECEGVITTSNSLAHYSVSQEIPCVTLCARNSAEPNSVFNKTLICPTNDVISYFTSPVEVAFRLQKRFGLWPDLSTCGDAHFFILSD